ncbi:MAG: ABC transporter substrate-binding protein [Rhodospirillales bacterium]|jgi:phospholipid transport system substrate-binding protein|nr:ABC transporter substrate-binding protein [Rhodospirillales bacterium]
MLVPRSLVAVVLAAALVLPLRPGVAAETPVETVETLHQPLLALMKDAATLSIEQRYARLAPTLSATYDFETMTRLAVGTAWTDASPDQRATLTEAFSRLSIATYAKRFSGYSGESFQTLGQKEGPRGTTLVETRLVRPSDPPVPLTYVLQKQSQGFRIIDVILQGSISELAVRRSEYAQVLRQGGVDALTRLLQQKSEEMLRGGG